MFPILCAIWREPC